MCNYPKRLRMTKQSTPLRLLIIEDNEGDFILLKKALNKALVPVEIFLRAQRLEEVPALVKEHPIDLAFLDLSLPDSNGIQSFLELNRQLSHVPIIVLSGLSSMKVALETIAHGAQDYLVKGEFDEKLLMKSIQYALERKKVLQKLRETNERYEIVNKATRDIIWDWNNQNNTVSFSTGIASLLGDQDPVASMDWLIENVHAQDRAMVRQSLANTLQKHIGHWDAEYRFKSYDGSYRYLYAKAYTVFDAEGRPARMIGAVADLTEKRTLENELAEQRLQQQKLITEITIRAQEKERSELARELHDNINQVLATVKMFLHIAKDDAAAREDLVKRSYDNINYAIEEIRKLSRSLVAPSLGDIGLEEALRELAAEINVSGSLKVNLVYENPSERKLDPTIELMLYRIVQEQKNNVLKYARASRATIILKIIPGQVFLSVADNGVGFNPTDKPRGIGLKNISSRVEFYSGRHHIRTAPGEGCTLEIYIPD